MVTRMCQEGVVRINLAVAMVCVSALLFPVLCIQTPLLHVDGKYFKDPGGNIVILRGVDLPDLAMLNTQRGTMSVTKMIDTLTNASHGWYAYLLRLCISPETWLGNPDSYYNSHLKPAVDYCVSKGVYCIIDWHYVADPAPNAASTVQFWTYIAPKFKTYTNVFYEIFNENSSTSMTWNQWDSLYAQPWENLIRQQAPDNIILVGGPSWSQNIGGSATKPVTGGNIAYVGHIYPQNPTSLWSTGGQISTAALTNPVVITEWGYLQGAAVPCSGTQTSFGNPFKTWVEQAGVSWTAWCADDVWDPKMFNSDWSLRTGDAQMGGFVKDWLSSKSTSNLPGTNVSTAPQTRSGVAQMNALPLLQVRGGLLIVRVPEVGMWTVRVVAPDGRTVLEQAQKVSIPVDMFAPGAYMVQVRSSKFEQYAWFVRGH